MTDNKQEVQDDGEKKLSAADIEREHLLRTAVRGQLLRSPPTWSEFIQKMHDGYIFVEGEEGIFRLRLMHREIIPIPSEKEEFHIPRRAKALLAKGGFSTSTNREFEQVMQNCAQPRDGDSIEDCWIRENVKDLLRESRRRGYAHSTEIWKNGELAGGTLGIQFNGVYISLSVFRRQSGAGNVAYIDLHHRLWQAGFQMHDAILPSNLSRFFGGHPIPFQEDFILRRKALRKSVVFPTQSAILPAENFPTQPKSVSTPYGRPLPR